MNWSDGHQIDGQGMAAFSVDEVPSRGLCVRKASRDVESKLPKLGQRRADPHWNDLIAGLRR